MRRVARLLRVKMHSYGRLVFNSVFACDGLFVMDHEGTPKIPGIIILGIEKLPR